MDIYAFHDGHACGYYRMLLPLTELSKHGHNVEFHVGWNERCRDFGVVAGQRIGNIEASALWRRLATPGRTLVWETDDDLFAIDPTNPAAYLTHTPDIIDAIELCARVADVVTVTNEPLADVMRRLNPHVAILPNHIDAALLDITRPRRDRITIGWAGGDSHLKDLAVVAAPLRRFLRRNPTVDLHTIGTNFLTIYGLPGQHTGWQQDIYDYYRSIDFDIGIAPLADTPFNRSKSGIKAIEYGALGIPTVATDMEPYRGVVLDGVTGYLVRSEHEWSRRLWELINDEPMRTEMGAKAKQHVAQWTVQQGWRRWEQAYAGLS